MSLSSSQTDALVSYMDKHAYGQYRPFCKTHFSLDKSKRDLLSTEPEQPEFNHVCDISDLCYTYNNVFNKVTSWRAPRTDWSKVGIP